MHRQIRVYAGGVLPDIPPIGDVVPRFAVTGWLGIGGHSGRDRRGLNRQVNAALADPAADLGSEPLSGSVADFAKLVAEETKKWAEVVKFAGIKAK